jgi:hypothetical protein
MSSAAVLSEDTHRASEEQRAVKLFLVQVERDIAQLMGDMQVSERWQELHRHNIKAILLAFDAMSAKMSELIATKIPVEALVQRTASRDGAGPVLERRLLVLPAEDCVGQLSTPSVFLLLPHLVRWLDGDRRAPAEWALRFLFAAVPLMLEQVPACAVQQRPVLRSVAVALGNLGDDPLRVQQLGVDPAAVASLVAAVTTLLSHSASAQY